MKHSRLDQLLKKVRSLLEKNGHSFSDADKAQLEAILAELEELLNEENAERTDQVLKLLSLVIRFLRFFGVDDFTDLF